MSHRTLIAILSLTACSALAQETRVDGPRVGVVHHPSSRSVRGIFGVPGASYLSDPLIDAVDTAAVSPDGRKVLVRIDGALFLNELENGTRSRLLEEDASGVARIAWNAGSTAAVVHDSAKSGVQFWSYSDGSFESAGRADLSALSGRLTSLLLDRAGRNAIAGVEAEGGGGIYLLAPDAEPRLLARVGRPGGIALASNGRDLYAGDRERQEILEIRDFLGTADTLLFASAIVDPVGLGLTADQGSLLVADASERSISAYDLASRLRTARIELDFTPSRFDQIGGKAVFLLSAGGETEPMQILDGKSPAAVYFIPVPAAQEEKQ